MATHGVEPADAPAPPGAGTAGRASQQREGPLHQVRRTAKAGARRAVRTAARTADRLRPPPQGMVVLLYHQVGGPRPTAVNLPVGLFTEQMEVLAASQRVRDLDAGLEWLAGNGDASGSDATTSSGDAPPVVITFDDGTPDVIEHALPVMERLGLPFVLYVATQWIDEGRSFWRDGTVLGWEGLREAHSTGLVTIGSHTHGHLWANVTPAAQYGADLDRATALLEDNLGVHPEHFAYPKAYPPTPEVAAEVRRRFSSAALGECRANVRGATDPYRLTRSPLQPIDEMDGFHAKVAGGMHLEDRVRSLAGNVRFRLGGGRSSPGAPPRRGAARPGSAAS